MKKLILRNFQSPGDILMLTAAVRELHRCHPGQYLTDVRTSCPDLWKYNPHIMPLREDDPEVESIECHYPLIHRSNSMPVHFLWGFMDYLNEKLNTCLKPAVFKGDLYLSKREKAKPSLISQMVGLDLPYWIIVAGGKYDFTVKWWHYRRFQKVVDHFYGRLQFVQVGEKDHYHPPLDNVICLRGQTNLRQLIHLVYHSQGAVCPVTFLMHLTAAVETRKNQPPSRPCVVIAGGREPPQWEAYPNHQFIHTVGTLACCATGGCWRSRTLPLGTGDEKDQPPHLCVDVANSLPRCMDMIHPDDVIRRLEYYLEKDRIRSLSREEFRRAKSVNRMSQRDLLLPHLS